MTRVLTIGSVAYDRIMDFHGRFADHFLPDELHNLSVSFLVEPPLENFGGTAGNIAYNLALLGEAPRIVGSAGNDFARYRTWLEGRGIDLSTLAEHDDVPTASAYIMTDTGDNQITAFAPGAGGRPYARDLELAGSALAIISPTCPDDMKSFPARLRDAGVPYLYDPGQNIPALSGDDLKAGITGAKALLVNDYELALVREKTGWSDADIISSAELLIETLGEEGSRILSKEGELRVAAAAVETVVDPTGAGDAYRAGFIKGLLAGLPLADSAQLAGVVAAYAVECYGTQNHSFTLDDIKKRYADVFGAPVMI